MANEVKSLIRSYKESTKAPKLARWASNIYYILSFIALGAGILAIIGFLVLLLIIAVMGEAFGGALFSDLGIVAVSGGLIFIFIGVVVSALGIAGLFVARGLRRGYKWARIAAIIISVLGVLGTVSSFNTIDIGNIVSGIAHGFVLYALLFDKESKNFYTR